MARKPPADLTHGEYEFVRYPEKENAIVLRYVGGMNINIRVQPWVLSRMAGDKQCCLCMARIKTGDKAWRPIARARNYIHRICQTCMVLIEHNKM